MSTFVRQFAFQLLGLVSALALLPAGLCHGQQQPPDSTVADAEAADRSRLAADWNARQKLIIPNPTPMMGEGDRYVVWLENGWLQVQRQTADDKVDWHIALAREIVDEVPVITAPPDRGHFGVSYAAGRFFVREDLASLRALLDPAPAIAAVLPPGVPIPASGHRLRGTANFNDPAKQCFVELWPSDGWNHVSGGLGAVKRFVLRLAPEQEEGYGTSSEGLGFLTAFYGDYRVTYEGDLLTATRVLGVQHQYDQQRQQLAGMPLPAIEAQQWFNVEGETLADDLLRGKVVLIDFWAGWCNPCMKKLPDVQALYEKYRERGLVVVGLHSPQGAEACEQLVAEQKLTFPVGTATEATERTFALEAYPSYLLVGRNGQIVAPPTSQLPSTEQIESLLATE